MGHARPGRLAASDRRAALHAGYPYGSSADDGDHAERNRVADNVIVP